MDNHRLPSLTRSTDSGYVYVVKRNDAYKIGFSRKGVKRRVKEAKGELILTIQTGQRPSVLEYALNRRFASKRLPPQPGSKREWFALDNADIAWLRGLAASPLS